MSFDLTNLPPGTYTLTSIQAIATTHFPDAYNSLLPSSSLAWKPVVFPSTDHHALIIGYIKVARRLHKVLACLSTADGSVTFVTRSDMALTRAQNAQIELCVPWKYLADEGSRPQLMKVKALCQYYFAGAQITTVAAWKCRIGRGFGRWRFAVWWLARGWGFWAAGRMLL